jgi:hypothetical protein
MTIDQTLGAFLLLICLAMILRQSQSEIRQAAKLYRENRQFRKADQQKSGHFLSRIERL